MNDRANEKLFQQLSAPAPRFEQPASYTVSVLLSLMVSLLLGLIYLGVLAASFWLTMVFLSESIGYLLSGRLVLAAILLPVGLMAGFLFLSLTKPFGLALSSGDEPIVLRREDEPFLYAYVERICDLLDTPKPYEIRVDLEPNASAGPASLVGGLFSQNLVLTLGLPLALGLNVQQFSGVIAHELGHFAQSGGGTELTRLLQVVSAGFSRLVFEQDWFDRFLERYSHRRHGALRVVLAPLRFCTYVSRKFFYLLMLAGHASSSFERRQKEFDADAYETYLAGYEAFRHCSRNLELLGASYQAAMGDLSDAWQDKRLIDNLPALTIANATQLPKHRQRQLYRLALTRKTAWHDSHPSHAERLNAAHRLGFPGIVHDLRPARSLFQGIHRICREATVRMLKDRLGDEFSAAKLVPASQFLREHEETLRAYKSLRHFYLGRFLIWRPLFPYPVAAKAPGDARQVMHDLKQRRQAMAVQSEKVSNALEELHQVDSRLILARQAHAVVELGYRIDPAQFELTAGNREHVSFTVSDLNATVERIGRSLEEYDRQARWRLTEALQLIHIRGIYNKLDEATRDDDRQMAVKLIGLCPQLEESQRRLAELRATIHVVAPLIPCVNPERPDPQLIQHILIQCRQSARRLGEILAPLSKVAYPFEHAQGHISIAKAITHRQPDAENPIDVVEAVIFVLERFDSLLARVLARLARIAEKVETALELAPLKQLKQRDELEEFVIKCEEEARAPKKWNDLAFAASRWALQIGITLGLTAVLCVGFLLFMALALPSGESEGAPSAADERGRADGQSPVASPATPRGSGRRTPAGPPAARDHGSLTTRRLYGGYEIGIPNDFEMVDSTTDRQGEHWSVRYHWRHTTSEQLSLSLLIERKPLAWDASLPRIEPLRLRPGQQGIIRRGDIYHVAGSTQRTFQAKAIRFDYAQYQAGSAVGHLYLGRDNNRLVEIRVECPPELTTRREELAHAVREFGLPPGRPRDIPPPPAR